MTPKEYTICAAETPDGLASEVMQHLASGWVLYGPPFTGVNGNGSGVRSVCQAMVRGLEQPVVAARPVFTATVGGGAAVRLATVAEETPTTARAPIAAPRKVPAPSRPERPIRPRMAVTFRNLAIFLGVLVAGSLLGDILLFRSGFYGQFLEPLSSTGTFERVLYAELHRPPSGKRDVLVVGNSRMAEGFSAKIANEYKADGYWFANCAVLGSPARSWYYFVRDADPQRNRYAAIAIPLDDYDDPDDTEDPANRISEMSLVINRLRFTDVLPFTFSFKLWPLRFEALRGSLFKGLVLQRDLYALLENRAVRLKSAKDYREHGSDWFYAYGGAERSMAGLSVDWGARTASFAPGTDEGTQQEFRRLMFTEYPQRGLARDFQTRWIGALADLYRNSKTRVVIYQIPRNPAPNPKPLAHLPWTTVDELRKRSWVRVVDRKVFEPLEKPELFFDYVHLNTAGRKVFSPLLAETVKENLK